MPFLSRPVPDAPPSVALPPAPAVVAPPAPVAPPLPPGVVPPVPVVVLPPVPFETPVVPPAPALSPPELAPQPRPNIELITASAVANVVASFDSGARPSSKRRGMGRSVGSSAGPFNRGERGLPDRGAVHSTGGLSLLRRGPYRRVSAAGR
jgi:hypothetical protein